MVHSSADPGWLPARSNPVRLAVVAHWLSRVVYATHHVVPGSPAEYRVILPSGGRLSKRHATDGDEAGPVRVLAPWVGGLAVQLERIALAATMSTPIVDARGRCEEVTLPRPMLNFFPLIRKAHRWALTGVRRRNLTRMSRAFLFPAVARAAAPVEARHRDG